MKLDAMNAEWYPVEEPQHMAQAYIDRVARKRARDEARTIRRCQRFAENLWTFALGAWTIFFLFAVLISI